MTGQQTLALDVQGLSKRFEDVQALEKIDFQVFSGELFGFLGPNGAGKTTTINILTGLARPDSGSIHIGGVDCIAKPRGAQHLLGVVPDESNLYAELSGFENLCFCATLYGMEKKERVARARELLDFFGLTPAANRKFGSYSKGMKRKLTIAAGIIHKPPILFLDEPTTGIDVASARQLRQLIAKLHEEGTTIFLTTHYIEEAERLCQRIAFIVEGRIVRVDRVEDLLQPIQNNHVLQLAYEGGPQNLKELVAEESRKEERDLAFSAPREGFLRVEAPHPIRVGPLVRLLEDQGAEVYEARKIRPSLENIFVQITGIETGIMNKEKERKGGKE
ncbi:MAG TPA: ABC transporter ATP-binding protein [Synergistaceae bacterium]|nr:ABC transporter ATP-binding protein [Synergistaceae bacterium]HPJ24855.1 ABC transporter ATP-binding protein [Synergistaceae bacterium]HPQ36454.1 ABC transporter ATP-binding protein [Synergistaceae bacterium]